MKTFTVAAGAVLVLTMTTMAAGADTWKVDPVHSLALFRVQHLGAGYTHGVFTGISGQITFNEAQPESGSIEIVVETASINTFNAARDRHLANEDFFDVEKYPEMRFKSTAWKHVDGDTFEITGEFTLHGVTKSIQVKAEKTGVGTGRGGGALIGFETTFSIKRSDYGMTNMIPAAGDEVRITVAIEAAEM